MATQRLPLAEGEEAREEQLSQFLDDKQRTRRCKGNCPSVDGQRHCPEGRLSGGNVDDGELQQVLLRRCSRAGSYW